MFLCLSLEPFKAAIVQSRGGAVVCIPQYPHQKLINPLSLIQMPERLLRRSRSVSISFILLSRCMFEQRFPALPPEGVSVRSAETLEDGGGEDQYSTHKEQNRESELLKCQDGIHFIVKVTYLKIVQFVEKLNVKIKIVRN